MSVRSAPAARTGKPGQSVLRVLEVDPDDGLILPAKDILGVRQLCTEAVSTLQQARRGALAIVTEGQRARLVGAAAQSIGGPE